MSDTNFILPTYPPGRNTGPTALRAAAGGGGGSVMSGGGGSAPATITLTPATSCGLGPSYTASLSVVSGDCGPCRKLSWIPTSGSGSRTIVFEQVECGTDGDGNSYIEFSSSDPLLCTDDAEECGENAVVVRVTCACCDTDGPGWYCVDGECQYLTACPASGEVVWAGPFDSEEECSCEVELDCCGGDTYPAALCVTFEDTFDYIGGQTVIATWNGAWWTGSVAFPDCDGTPWFVIITPCTGGIDEFVVLVNHAGSGSGLTVHSGTCASLPFTVEGTFTIFVNDCVSPGSSSGDVTVAPYSEDCVAGWNPPQATYNCIPGTGCVEVYDGSGVSLAECQEECGGVGEACCNIQVGDPATLVIVGGPDAGTYFVAWDNPWAGLGFPNWRRAYFVVGGSAYYVTCGGAGGIDGFAISGPGFGITEPDSTACDPTAVVWNGLGTTTTITLS